MSDSLAWDCLSSSSNCGGSHLPDNTHTTQQTRGHVQHAWHVYYVHDMYVRIHANVGSMRSMFMHGCTWLTTERIWRNTQHPGSRRHTITKQCSVKQPTALHVARDSSVHRDTWREMKALKAIRDQTLTRSAVWSWPRSLSPCLKDLGSAAAHTAFCRYGPSQTHAAVTPGSQQPKPTSAHQQCRK